jgi:hypothetical protein
MRGNVHVTVLRGGSGGNAALLPDRLEDHSPQGTSMTCTIGLPSPAERHPSLVYERHPDFGDYIYSPTIASWTQRRAQNNGHPLLLCGRGRSPSVEQITLWHEIDSRLGELTAVAIAAVGPPPIKPRRRFFSHAQAFSRNELVLGRRGET